MTLFLIISSAAATNGAAAFLPLSPASIELREKMEFDVLVTSAAESICRRRSDPELCTDMCSKCQNAVLEIISSTAEYLENIGKAAAAAELRAGLHDYQATPMDADSFSA